MTQTPVIAVPDADTEGIEENPLGIPWLTTPPLQMPTVLYIGGDGRSGSTLLEGLLARQPGTAAVGELRQLWRRGLLDGELCGCGKPVRTCSFWSEVGRRLVGGWERISSRALADLVARVDRTLRLPLMSCAHPEVFNSAWSAEFAEVQALVTRLYAVIGEVAGVATVIDSSKHPSWACLLWSAGVDLRVVHLIRHPCGVVHSSSSPVHRPQAGAGEQWMPAHRAVDVVFRWSVFNLLFHVLQHRGIPTLRLRYEDLAEDPEAAVTACFDLMECDGAQLQMRDHDSRIQLGGGHGIAGNPIRMGREPIRLEVDRCWLDQLPDRERWLTGLMTAPLRLAYGYRIRRSARAW
ncbi:MAG: sulfotransferase [Egibacteraceae bacterium]